MNMESKLLTDTQIRIQDQAKSLFMKFGFRSVSMDDIANALGISKKTIYHYFTDKDELVQAIVKQDICETENEWANCLAIAENAIDEIFITMDNIIKHIKNMNPTILFDLQKFHFNAFTKIVEHKNAFLLSIIKNNLKRGIEEQLYRSDLNVEVLSRFRLEMVFLSFNLDVFPLNEFTHSDVTQIIMENFIFGLVTEKGYQLAIHYKTERNK
jgi:TetR/AcrR family transcriptional regulator, cholesterol catabolism regulator